MISRKQGYRDVLKIVKCKLIVQTSSHKSWSKLKMFREETIMKRFSFLKGDSGGGVQNRTQQLRLEAWTPVVETTSMASKQCDRHEGGNKKAFGK